MAYISQNYVMNVMNILKLDLKIYTHNGKVV